MSFLYFAYGSNMLPARLKARCSSAQVRGIAAASNHFLQFSKPGKDNSGKATLVVSGDQALYTPGVIFEIAKADLTSLDRAEGAGYGYDREESFQVTDIKNGELLTVTTYLASKTDMNLKPFDWYLALVLAGVNHHALEVGHETRLREIDYDVDANHAREGRIQAVAALAEHGFADHHELLIGA